MSGHLGCWLDVVVSMGLVNRCRPEAVVIAFLAVVWMLSWTGCHGADERRESAAANAPSETNASPSETVVPTPTRCPVAAAFCQFAANIEFALQQNDVGILDRATRLQNFSCPFPRPAGAGGPYPLCDSVQRSGETRAGVGFTNDTTSFVYPEERMHDQIWRLITDDATSGFDWRIRSLACGTTDGVSDCSRVAIAFGKENDQGELVGEETQLLVLRVSSEGGGQVMIDGAVIGFAMKDAPHALHGGTVESPGHLLFFTYREFWRWSPT
jgi:hypothetical protein